MFRLILKSQPHSPTPALADALTSDGLAPGMQASRLSVVEQHGTYSGRRVSYFRVFDPDRAAERDLRIRRFTDLDRYPNLILGSGHLDANPELVLGSGHFEADGAVVLSKRDRPAVTAHAVRTEADRAAHGDDERLATPR